MLPEIKSQTAEELQARFQEWGEPAYRLTQLLEWLYVHRVSSWEAMTNLPKTLRDKLKSHYGLNSLELVRQQGSRDTTQKFLWRLQDHSLIESVLIPSSPSLYGEPSDRQTLCVSTQVGCAYGCAFCASGLEGLKRNLGVDEIVDQLLAVEKSARLAADKSSPELFSGRESSPSRCDSATARRAPQPSHPGRGSSDVLPLPGGEGRGEGEPTYKQPAQSDAPASPVAGESRLVSNLVIMGMGEPLANYDNLLKALKILNAPWGGRIGARKITISTSGLAPQIRKLADEPLQFRLAISLHGATDETRNKIMPVNRRYPLRELAAACEYYQQKKGRMITFEYILIAGINDSLGQVTPLAELARRLNAKVNLIPYNKVEGLPWERPSEATQEAFHAALEKHKIPATLRREKGHDIDAACGQLRLKTEHEEALPT